MKTAKALRNIVNDVVYQKSVEEQNKAIDWIENTYAPLMESYAREGLTSIALDVPDKIAILPVVDYLKNNGYTVSITDKTVSW